MIFPEMFLLWFRKKVQKPKSCEWWLSKVNIHANECEDRTGYAFGVQEQIMRFGLRKWVAPWFMPRTWLQKDFLNFLVWRHIQKVLKRKMTPTQCLEVLLLSERIVLFTAVKDKCKKMYFKDSSTTAQRLKLQSN